MPSITAIVGQYNDFVLISAIGMNGCPIAWRVASVYFAQWPSQLQTSAAHAWSTVQCTYQGTIQQALLYAGSLSHVAICFPTSCIDTLQAKSCKGS